ncbi:MAG: hypothetical protein R3A80_07460 [Bdellovibrionota bacterium]
MLVENSLQKNFIPEAADGAWIHYAEKGNDDSNTVLIEFTQADMKQEKDFPSYRMIPYCNILFKGSAELFKKIPAENLNAAKFYWTQEKTENGVLYKVVGMLPENINWFFQSLEEKQNTLIPPENIENARQFNEDATYTDRSCARTPYSYKKKLYSAKNTIRSEWYEKEGTEKFEETLYDNSGKKLSGQVNSEFVYFVEKSEAFKNGFGKAGMLKCQGYYTYKDGIKHGPYEFYYPGHIAKAFLGQYENGVQVGMQKLYNPNGTLKKTWDVGNSNSSVGDALTLSR